MRHVSLYRDTSVTYECLFHEGQDYLDNFGSPIQRQNLKNNTIAPVRSLQCDQ